MLSAKDQVLGCFWFLSYISTHAASDIPDIRGGDVSEGVRGEGGSAEPPDSGSLPPLPNIERIIPASGPITGGTKVSLIGSGFPLQHPCAFGGSPAPTIQQNEILCLCMSPPSDTPGPVTVRFERVGFMGTTQIFTYVDTRENEAYVCSSRACIDLNH